MTRPNNIIGTYLGWYNNSSTKNHYHRSVQSFLFRLERLADIQKQVLLKDNLFG